MNVAEFADLLELALLELTFPHDLKNEKAFEEEHIVPEADRIARSGTGVSIFVHPFGKKETCDDHCQGVRAGTQPGRLGCPDCWAWTKSWATVAGFGMRHTVDIVGRDSDGETIAIEIKWIRFKGKQAPNSEFQRFVGQCALAAAKHSVVLGICGLRGKSNRFDEDRVKIVEKLGAMGARLAVLQTTEQLEDMDETALH